MTSYAALIADRLDKGLLQPRVLQNKQSGNKAPILGAYEPEDSVALFDDVVTDGTSKIDMVHQLRSGDLDVLQYYVLLDREEGGSPQVADQTGIGVIPALGVSSLAVMLRDEGLMNPTQFGNVARYLTQYGEPHAQETINAA